MTKRTIMPKHDPDAYLDYKIDWRPLTNGTPGGASDWLAPGETIESYTLTADDGITIQNDSSTDSDTSVTFWVSVTPATGADPVGSYNVTCSIVTSAGREDDRTITIPVEER